MSWNKPRREPKQIDIGHVARPRTVAPSIGLAAALAAVPAVTQVARVPSSPNADEAQGRRIKESARGEECDIRIPGVCNFDRATTVWSHYPGLAGGRGMGLKSLHLCGVYACFACHDIVDDRAPAPAGMSRQEVMLSWHEGHLRSLVKLRAKGII